MKNIIFGGLALTLLAAAIPALAGVCQGTTASWTTNQTTCGARSLDAIGVNATVDLDKGLKVKRLNGTTGAAARGLDSAGNSLPVCTVTDTKLDTKYASIFTDACDPGVKYTYQITW